MKIIETATIVNTAMTYLVYGKIPKIAQINYLFIHFTLAGNLVKSISEKNSPANSESESTLPKITNITTQTDGNKTYKPTT